MALPKLNQSSDVNQLKILSFQESMLYVLEDVRDSIDKQSSALNSLLKVEKTELTNDRLQEAQEAAEQAEEKRESRFATTMKSAGSAIAQKGQEVASNFSGSNLLSTLIGGAVLSAFFAPEKFNEIVGFVREKVESYAPAILDMVGKFLNNLNFSDLLVTGIFGLKGGLIYSILKFAGDSLKEKLEQTFGTEFDNWFANNFGAILGVGGLMTFLFPAATFGAIKNLVTSMGTGIATQLSSAATKTAVMSKVTGMFTPKLTTGILAKAGLFAAVGFLAESAITGAADYFRSLDVGPGAEKSTKKALQDMTGAVATVTGSAAKYAGIGAALGSIFPGIGTAIGFAIGGLIGSVAGVFDLTDEDTNSFVKGISQLWENITGEMSKGLAKLVKQLPSFLIPDSALEWANKTLGEENIKLTDEDKKAAIADSALSQKLTDQGLSAEQQTEFKQKLSEIDSSEPKAQQKMIDLAGEYNMKLGDVGSKEMRSYINTQTQAKVSKAQISEPTKTDKQIQDEFEQKSRIFGSKKEYVSYMQDFSLAGETGSSETTKIIGSGASKGLTEANRQITESGAPGQTVNVVAPSVNNTNNIDQSNNNSYSRTSVYSPLREMYSPENIAARKFSIAGM